jgi:small basic protein
VIWLAWRQFRTQAYVAIGVLAAIGIVFAITRPSLMHVYDTSVLTCQAHGNCASATQNFLKRDHLLRDLSLVVILVPALVGVFWGAPLVAREMENGTFRLIWTQSVTRTKWIVTRIALVGLFSVLVTGLYSLLVTWWSSPFDTINDNPYALFDLRDITPIGYAALAFALGVTAGIVIRRTVPAMAASLVAFAAIRIAFTEWVRPHFMSPLHSSGPFRLIATNGQPAVPGKGQAGDWIISEVTYNAQGAIIGQNGGIGPNGDVEFRSVSGNGTRVIFQGVGKCPNKFPVSSGSGQRNQVSNAAQEAVNKCLASFHLRDTLTYQPTSRFWTFQWYEMSIYIVLALVLTGLSVWWVRRRLA